VSKQFNIDEYDVAIVGAGAAGQLAAIAAAQRGARVALVEQMPRPGLKLLATGGGRCNITNTLSNEELVAAFGRHGRFIMPALEALGPAALRKHFAEMGVPTVVEEGGKVFPASQSAAQVQAALSHRCRALGVMVRVDCPVTALRIADGHVKGIEAPDDRGLAARRVILCCGGRSYPRLGGTGGGYALARQAGHIVVEPTPALVALVVPELYDRPWPRQLAGAVFAGARIWIDMPRQPKAGITGDVLLTHRGLSGPAALDISGTVARLLAAGSPAPLRMELIAGRGVGHWRREIESWRTGSGRRAVATMLQGTLTLATARLLCELAGVRPEATVSHLPAAAAEALAGMLGAMKLQVTDTEGFDTAFVTRGGVRLKEVDPATLQSRLVNGLYFAGELLDLDGPTGGYNLQWAFASGYLAGTEAAPA
jgi:predicted Rossmann fold flavoprotein